MSQIGNAIVIGIFVLVVIIIGSVFGWLTVPLPTTLQPNEPVNPFDWTGIHIGFIIVPIIIFFLTGIRIVRQTHRAVIETFGKYSRFMDSGITWIIPLVQKLYSLNVTEQLVDLQSQDIITSDNLNANVDAQVYFMIGKTEDELKHAFYNVDRVEIQIVQLAKTTLRNIIGQKPFKEVNSNRSDLNKKIFDSLKEQTKDWGVIIVRVELKQISPPDEVQVTMNSIIQAENKKIANKDLALAQKIQAEGQKNAMIQEALGDKQQKILRAQGEAEAIIMVATADAERIKLINTSAQLYFRNEAIILKHLEITRDSLQDNSKIVLTKDGISPTLVLNETSKDIIPIPKGYERTPAQEEELRKSMITEYIKTGKKPRSSSKHQIDPETITKMFAS